MKPKLIIFEGADCVGKSSIAQGVCEQLDYIYLHFGKPNFEKPWGYQYSEIPVSQSYVLDRSWISGIFYDNYRRAKLDQRLVFSYMGLFMHMHDKFDIQYVFVTRPWSTTELAHKAEIAEGITNSMPGGRRVLTLVERKAEHDAFNLGNNIFSDFRKWLNDNALVYHNVYTVEYAVQCLLKYKLRV